MIRRLAVLALAVHLAATVVLDTDLPALLNVRRRSSMSDWRLSPSPSTSMHGVDALWSACVS